MILVCVIIKVFVKGSCSRIFLFLFWTIIIEEACRPIFMKSVGVNCTLSITHTCIIFLLGFLLSSFMDTIVFHVHLRFHVYISNHSFFHFMYSDGYITIMFWHTILPHGDLFVLNISDLFLLIGFGPNFCLCWWSKLKVFNMLHNLKIDPGT